LSPTYQLVAGTALSGKPPSVTSGAFFDQ
jgi:hypothetical protein